MARKFGITLMLLTTLAVKGLAQDSGLGPVAARTGFTESLGTVPRGHILLEGGTTFTRAGSLEIVAIGEALLHVPAGSRTEFQLGANSYVMTYCPDGDDSGLGDAFVAAKTALTKSWNLSVGTTIPMSRRTYRERAFQPSVKLMAGSTFGERLTLASNLSYAYARQAGERFHQVAGGVWMGCRLTDRAGSYAEVYGFSASEQGGAETACINTGLTFLLNHNNHLDLHLGTGLINTGSGFSVGIGVARQW